MNPATATFPALGTTAEITTLDAAALSDAIDVLERELAAIDRACSRFRSDSEVMRLAANGGRWMPASPLLREALRAGIHAAAATGGAVDPTIGASMRALGWDADFRIVVSRRGPARVKAVPAAGWRRIEVDAEHRRVRVPAGVEIDLGATAKALAADRTARAAWRVTGAGVLVNLGGDIAVAGPAPAGGWPILVTDDHRAPSVADGQTVSIAAGGLATSSTTVRRWRTTDGVAHHVVDPRTGRPAPEVWRTVSVAAGDCVDANAAATASIVMGETAPDWLRALRLPARLVRADGRVVVTGGWPAGEEEPVACAA
ncbi:MAG TPA: FAD:protein FMN transferase [Gaiellaceae bacterium]|nr:FAD:protein FMN transferase [Gaiellaceae bacterium]